MNKIVLLFVVSALAVITSGCTKESATPTTSDQTPASAPAVTNAMLVMSTKVVSAVSATTNVPAAVASNVASVATNLASTNVVAAKSAAQSILDRTQSLIAQKNYTEAGTALASLKNQSLSPEEQSLWQKLQTQVQKALADQAANDGAKALGGLLGK